MLTVWEISGSFFILPVAHEADPPLWKIRSLKFRKYDPQSSTKKWSAWLKTWSATARIYDQVKIEKRVQKYYILQIVTLLLILWYASLLIQGLRMTIRFISQLFCCFFEKFWFSCRNLRFWNRRQSSCFFCQPIEPFDFICTLSNLDLAFYK